MQSGPDTEGTKKRGQGPSFEDPQQKGAKETSGRIFPRLTPDSLIPSLATSPEQWIREEQFPWIPRVSPVPFQDDPDLAPWNAPGALNLDFSLNTGPNGTVLLPSGEDEEESPQVQPGNIFFNLGFFRVDYGRAREYAKKVKQEMEDGKPYSMGKQQKVYEKFIVPYDSCVFWEKYKYQNLYLGGGSYGLVLGFEYNGRDMAVKFEAYKSGNDVKYKDMVNEIAMNALINQLPQERRFGVVEMFDWARCHFSFSEAIGVEATMLLADKKPVVIRPQTWQMIVFERAGLNLMDVFLEVWNLRDQERTYKFWSAVYLQVVVTQLYLWRNLEFRHLDLHWMNILTKREPNPTYTHILYILHNMRGSTVYYRVPLSNTNNLLMMISDMGRASSGSMQIIRDSAYEDPINLRSQTEIDLRYMLEVWARTVFDPKDNEMINIISEQSRNLFSQVVSDIVGPRHRPGLGYIDFEKLILETNAFDQYKTDQPQPQPTDRVMEVSTKEFMSFTQIEASRSRK